jgi:hypothetical protein
MKKLITLFAIAGLVLALAPAAQAAPITAPGDGYTGSYRLVFATSSHPMADSSRTMTDFDADVTAAANAVPALVALGTTWKCLGSTPTIDARDNTNTNPNDETGIPIYTTTGLRVADDNADLWDGTIQNAIWLDDGTTSGTSSGYENYQWTGSGSDGTARYGGSDGPLGSTYANGWATRGGYVNSNWFTNVSINLTDTRGARMIGMSGVIPEPATMSLLAIGGIALIRRRRRA